MTLDAGGVTEEVEPRQGLINGLAPEAMKLGEVVHSLKGCLHRKSGEPRGDRVDNDFESRVKDVTLAVAEICHESVSKVVLVHLFED
jgi:hypothetical protein